MMRRCRDQWGCDYGDRGAWGYKSAAFGLLGNLLSACVHCGHPIREGDLDRLRPRLAEVDEGPPQSAHAFEVTALADAGSELAEESRLFHERERRFLLNQLIPWRARRRRA